jgi:acyl carrier protein
MGSRQLPTGQPRLREIVTGAVAAAAQLRVEDIRDDSDLFELGLDSLDLTSIVVDIEDGTGGCLSADELDCFFHAREVITVADIVRSLSSR